MIARGGRYDDVGKVFGRARGATGFDMDLRGLVEMQTRPTDTRQSVLAPVGSVPAPDDLWRTIVKLRDEGYVVIEAAGTPPPTDWTLYHDGEHWTLK